MRFASFTVTTPARTEEIRRSSLADRAGATRASTGWVEVPSAHSSEHEILTGLPSKREAI